MATREALAIRREQAFGRIAAAAGIQPPAANRDADVTLTELVEWVAELIDGGAPIHVPETNYEAELMALGDAQVAVGQALDMPIPAIVGPDGRVDTAACAAFLADVAEAITVVTDINAAVAAAKATEAVEPPALLDGTSGELPPVDDAPKPASARKSKKAAE